MQQDTLRRSVAALGEITHLPRIAQRILAQHSMLLEQLQQQVLDGVEAYAESANPDVEPELRQHLSDLISAVATMLQDPQIGDFDFVRAYARQRARQHFPLEATLHTYRSCHRALSTQVRDAAIAAANDDAQVRRVVANATDLVIDFADAISTLATAEYVKATRLQAAAEGNRQSELLDVLLRGHDEADTRTAELLKRGGYLAQRQSFCVVVARSVDAREMDSAARAQRMVAALRTVLENTPIRVLIGVRDGVVTAVLSGTRRISGWTAPQTLLADRILPRLQQVGPAAIIGLSDDAPSTSHIRRAHKEALIALDFADVANRVMPYREIPFRQMLIRHARDSVQSALPAWLDGFIAADKKARGKLEETLRAYATANMNALQASKALAIHANTIYSRMQRIESATGKDPLNYYDLSELLLAIESVVTNR